MPPPARAPAKELTPAQELVLGSRGAVPIAGLTPTQELLLSLQAREGGKGFGTLTEPGGFFQRKVESLERVGSAFGETFEREFGELQFKPKAVGVPGVPVVDPLLRGLTRAGGEIIKGGEAVGRTLMAIPPAGFDAVEQSLLELGLSDTEARKGARASMAASDTLAITTAVSPPLAVRAAVRKVTGATATTRLRKATREEREAILAAKKINLARKRAREEAERLGIPEEQFKQRMDVAAATVRADLNARADKLNPALLRSPEEILDSVPTLTQGALTADIQKQAVQIAKSVLLDRGIEPSALAFPRVQNTVVSLLGSDRNFTVRLFTEVNAAGMSVDTFLDAFLFTGSEAGRALQIRSAFFNGLRSAALKGDKGAAETLTALTEKASQAQLGLTALEQTEPLWKRGGNLFRKLVISLPATAVRNYIDATIRISLGAMNRVFDESLRRMFPTGRDIAGPLDPLGELSTLFGLKLMKVKDAPLPGQIKKRFGERTIPVPKALSNREKVELILGANPEYRSSLRRAVDADLAQLRIKSGTASGLDKFEALVDKYALFMNRAQEFYVRYGVFGPKLDQELRRVGSSLDEVIRTGDIPIGMDRALRLATERALDITFALDPAQQKGFLAAIFRPFADVIDAIPGGPIFIETFPRFLFNLTKFIAEQTPTAGLKLIRPTNRAKIAEGDTSVLAREIVGTTLMALAFAIRQGDIPELQPGARFDEVLNEKGERVSFLPFATLAPFFFMADFIIRIDEGRILATTDDLRELRRGLTASSPEIGRLTSTMEDFIENLLNIDSTQDLDNFLELLGEKATGFLRPAQLIRDFREEFNDAIRVQRERRGRGFTGPITNLLAPEKAPVRESPTREGPLVSPRVDLPFGLGTLSGGLVSQVSGIRLKDPRTPIEKSLVRLGFTGRELSPKTGNGRLDALVLRFQGTFMEKIGNPIVKSEGFKALGVKEQQEELRVLLSGGDSILFGKVTGVRKRSLALAKLVAPFAFLERDFKRLPGTQKEAFIQRYNRIIAGTGVELPAEEFIRLLQNKAVIDLEKQGL